VGPRAGLDGRKISSPPGFLILIFIIVIILAVRQYKYSLSLHHT